MYILTIYNIYCTLWCVAFQYIAILECSQQIFLEYILIWETEMNERMNSTEMSSNRIFVNGMSIWYNIYMSNQIIEIV